MRFLRKWLILSHRYLGIALSLLFVMWFASGIVMIYAGGMPQLAPDVRRAHLPDLDMSRVTLDAAAAAAKADLDSPQRVLLTSVLERPAYRFGGRGAVTVFADTGDQLTPLSAAQARTVASGFVGVPEDRVQDLGEVTRPDQWTIALGPGAGSGLRKFRVADDASTEVYVSPHLGGVILTTTSRERLLAWIGVIPHWMYFTALRINQPLWFAVVVWTSGIACLVALLGLVLSITQFRKTRPFNLSAAVPYAGWMRWHYLTGAVFGVFALTWAFSGLLSMEPFEWTNATGLEVDDEVFTGGPLDIGRFPRVEAAAWAPLAGGRAIKEVEFARIQDEPYYVIHRGDDVLGQRRERLHQPYSITGRAERDRVLASATTMQPREQAFSEESLVSRLKAAVPDVPIVAQTILTDYDSYYYSRGRQTPLPVLRVKFDDPMQTWVYVDPEMSRVLGTVHRLNRVERWLYNGLHSLDFSFWYWRRPCGTSG